MLDELGQVLMVVVVLSWKAPGKGAVVPPEIDGADPLVSPCSSAEEREGR
jgi:hypothetical protein